ncbi:MAG: GNAT family N-acetyltransferase [Planctomycetes bacterium]|nr:GNAT family N-acetyltransferase [Planctomycetota bacterium]MCW8135036.1 GNAT family N-acetyltransferase [Planctomycetota bacterium]
MRIRDYDHKRDAAAFRALNYRTFRDSIPPDEPVNEAEFRRHYEWLLGHFAPQDASRNTVFVAEVDSRYAGHIWIGTQTDFFTRRVDPWVFDLSVAAEFRGKGVARALHEHATAWLRKSGAKVVGLQVMAHNKEAAAMYEKLGYKPRAHSLKLSL